MAPRASTDAMQHSTGGSIGMCQAFPVPEVVFVLVGADDEMAIVKGKKTVAIIFSWT